MQTGPLLQFLDGGVGRRDVSVGFVVVSGTYAVLSLRFVVVIGRSGRDVNISITGSGVAPVSGVSIFGGVLYVDSLVHRYGQ